MINENVQAISPLSSPDRWAGVLTVLARPPRPHGCQSSLSLRSGQVIIQTPGRLGS